MLSTLKKIKTDKTAVFCGAGISFNSGLPLANSLIVEILKKFELSEDDINLIINSNLPFESFIDVLLENTDATKLLEIFQNNNANSNHYLIAHWAKLGIVKNIFTTNFDLCIEQALEDLGLKRNINFNVFTSEKEFHSICWEENIINLIKIHGCATDIKEMGITMKSVANKTLSINKRKLISDFFNKKFNPHILILGYSCSDLFDISPEIEAINSDQSEILFIEHTSNTDQKFGATEHISLKQEKNPFIKFNDGIRLYTNTDSFIKETWKLTIESPIELIKYPRLNWDSKVDLWYDLATKENTERIKWDLCGQLFYNIGEFQTASFHFQKAVNFAIRNNDHLGMSNLAGLGMSYNMLGEYERAQECIEDVLQISIGSNNTYNYIAQLQNLGNIYRNLGKLEKAKNVLCWAVIVSEFHNEKFSLGNSLGNLALVYNLKYEPDNAMRCLEYGLQISQEIGNKQAECSQLCSLGIALMNKGNLSKAEEFMVQSIKIAELIGARGNEAEARVNIAVVKLNQGQYNEAIFEANKSLEIADTIFSKSIQGLAFFLLGQAFFFLQKRSLAISNMKKSVDIFITIYPMDHPNLQAAIKLLKEFQSKE